MVATPFRPITWNSEPVTQQRLQQMANNAQWLYENNSRMRYSAAGLVRDNGIKKIVGKSPRSPIVQTFQYVEVYFGNFFTPGCKPIVQVSLEAGNHRSKVVAQGYGGELDHRGFTAVVTTESGDLNAAGWIHWEATGY